MPKEFDALKTRHRYVRDKLPDSLDLRVHRSLSWLDRSERCEDEDGRFVFLWIAFNAAYAQEMSTSAPMPEQRVLRGFLEKLVMLDHDGRLSSVVWTEFPNTIHLLLNNQYVFQPYWDCQNGVRPRGEWQGLFERAKVTASRALGSNDTARVLGEVFARLYTLRNQIMHGGSTWQSSVNREQVRDGANILGQLVPVVIDILMAHTETHWGEPCYPVVFS